MERRGTDGGVEPSARKVILPSRPAQVRVDPCHSSPQSSDRPSRDPQNNGVEVNGDRTRTWEAAQSPKRKRSRSTSEIQYLKLSSSQSSEYIEHCLETAFPIGVEALLLSIPAREPSLPIRLPHSRHRESRWRRGANSLATLLTPPVGGSPAEKRWDVSELVDELWCSSRRP